MAFLDNSGDIILDAVLTDVGRKRMAQGDFSINKFSVGDDEIDYQLYNKNHPSGSAYYDLEILQTPILEAFTQTNASIKYGLTTYSSQNLLYLPSIAINQKSNVISSFAVASKSGDGVIYLCDDTTVDSDGNPTSAKINSDTNANVLGSDDTAKVILVETGITSDKLVPNGANQSQYIIRNGLLDNNFTVSFDSNYISQVQAPGADGASFTNAGRSDGKPEFNFGALEGKGGAQSDTIMKDYQNATIPGFTNQVFEFISSGADVSKNYSAITGPRGSFTCFSLKINTSNISNQTYTEFGRTNQTQGTGTETYDYIDTIIYVRGATTGMTLQIPIRIIRLST